MDLKYLGISCLVNAPHAVVLSISSGVAGCECPISRSYTRSGVASLALTKAPNVSDSEATTCLNMLASTWIGVSWKINWFPIGILGSIFLPREWCPQNLLLMLDTDK